MAENETKQNKPRRSYSAKETMQIFIGLGILILLICGGVPIALAYAAKIIGLWN